MTSTFCARILGPVMILLLSFAAGGAQAQSLPIPGLPGGLGGLGAPGGSSEGQADPPPAERQPETGDPSAAGAGEGAGAGADAPTQALIDILRDDAAREALIRQLEQAAGAAAPAEGEAAGTAQPEAPAAAEQAGGDQTVGALAVGFTRSLVSDLMGRVQDGWLRLARVPDTLELATRAFEGDALSTAAVQAGRLALGVYITLFLLRLGTGAMRRRIGRAALGAGWLKRLWLRFAATGIDLIAVPISVGIGIAVVYGGIAYLTPGSMPAQMTTPGALFVNAFIAVELTRVVFRFLLSPGTHELRLIPLSDAAAASMWRATNAVIYVLGYGQLLIVPVINDGVSLFVGRAVAAVIASVAVIGLILYVLLHRRAVAVAISPPVEEDVTMDATRRWLADRWHWPVLAYLVYVLGTVMTRPGNVLLPMLWTTAQVAAALAVGSMVIAAVNQTSERRLTVPTLLSSRLPLLEERLNQLVPAFLRVFRFAIGLAVLVLILDILEIQNVGGLLSGGLTERLSSGLFSVLLVVALLSIAWLGMVSWVDYRLNPFVGKVPTPREITLLTLMKNAVTVALVIVGIILSLAQLGMNVAPLIASAGVIGLAISFGAQRMVEDIFSGVFIQAENAMNVGDVVDVAGTVGTVEKLTVRSVTLRDLSGVVHVIPFSSATKVSNYMRDYAYHVADMGVAYREDADDVKQAMHDAFEELCRDPEFGQYVIGDMEWFGLNAFGASEVQMRARIKTVPGQQWAVGRAYNEVIKRIFDAREIEIPFPHQTIYFGTDKSGKAPPAHVAVDELREVARPTQDAPAEEPESPPEGEDRRVVEASSRPDYGMPDADGR